MVGFLIKKAFFDFWDNLLRVVMINIGFVILMGAGVWGPYLLRAHLLPAFIVFFIVVTAFHIYIGAASMFIKQMVDYETPTMKDFLSYFKEIWKSGLFLSFIATAQVVLIVIGFPFYLSVGGMLGIGALSIIFWASIAWWLASQYFFAIRARLDTKIGKIFKKSFIVFIDNTGFTIFLGLATIAVFIISVLTAFLLPGFAGIIIWHQAAFKLRLYKYDHLEANTNADKKIIPWNKLLKEDRERVGKRTLRGMIFPWKE